QNPEAVMAVLTADHFIGNEDTFRHVLAAAYKVASTDGVVTLGIEPDHPSTGFGYIERGSLAHKVGETAVYELKQFHEKPDRAVAERYIQSGIYSWNSGMFIWQVGRVMEEFRLHSPDIHGILCRIEDTLGTPRYASVLEQEWPKIQRTTIDYALLEHIKSDIYVIPVEMGWQDIGNFSTLYDILAGSDGANISQCQQPVIQIDTRGTLIISKRLVAAVGVADLVIVDTDDALLVTTRAHAQEVKTIVEELKKRNLDSYL
nr:mannose-1-phosphate guanylyltransferase [Anaerolineae bacterium]